MAWYKSRWRQAVSSRQLRHSLSLALAQVAPGMTRDLNFYGSGVAVADVAISPLFVDKYEIDKPLAADQVRFIQEQSYVNDGPLIEDYWQAPFCFQDEFFELEDVWMLGHTGMIAKPSARAIVTEWGEAENRNRDKLARLQTGEPVDAVALPVRKFTNYFHIFFDIVLPMISYLESDRKAAGPHEIVAMRNDRPFVRETLRAVASAYGLGFREVDRKEKISCKRAVLFRRTRPAKDWFPARPENARRLRDVLLAHFGRSPDSPHAGFFLDRGPAKLRTLKNAQQVRELARGAGLEIFAPSGGNFADQVARMAGARTIMSVHGAALTNMLFAEPGARVIELFGSGSVKSVYMMLAHMLGHEHVRVLATGPDDATQGFEADIGAVAAALDAARTATSSAA